MNSHGEEKDAENKLVTRADISEAFRSEISKIIYAWRVVKLLGKVTDNFLEQNTVTISYLNAITRALKQSLQDSSEVDAVFRLLMRYLKSHDANKLDKLKETLEEKADIVLKRIETFDIPNQQVAREKKANNPLMETYIAGSDLLKQYSLFETAELLDGTTNRVLRVGTFMLGLWMQEKERIKHDFRLYEGTDAQKWFEYECEEALSRLNRYCDFVNDILSVRSSYETVKLGFFTSKISDKKTAIITAIEVKLAETMRDSGRLNPEEVYLNFLPTLQEQAEKIEKPGKLKTLLETIKQRHDATLKPNQNPKPIRGFGQNNT